MLRSSQRFRLCSQDGPRESNPHLSQWLPLTCYRSPPRLGTDGSFIVVENNIVAVVRELSKLLSKLQVSRRPEGKALANSL